MASFTLFKKAISVIAPQAAEMVQPMQQVRFAVNEKAVKIRMKTVGNIRKITKAMKMVAASKLRADERRLKSGRPFTQSATSVVLNPKGNHSLPENDYKTLPPSLADKKPTTLVVAVTSDRGLCGGINSAVAKEIRNAMPALEKTSKVAILTVGDKGKAALSRTQGHLFWRTLTECWKQPMNFLTASALADRMLASPADEYKVVFNKFQSMISFATTTVTIPSKAALKETRFFPRTGYAIEGGDDTSDDLYEFFLANSVYNALLENATSEQSARMTAMDNASKNAGEMLDSLRLQYNKARQSRITTELIEIISGASSL